MQGTSASVDLRSVPQLTEVGEAKSGLWSGANCRFLVPLATSTYVHTLESLFWFWAPPTLSLDTVVSCGSASNNRPDCEPDDLADDVTDNLADHLVSMLR